LRKGEGRRSGREGKDEKRKKGVHGPGGRPKHCFQVGKSERINSVNRKTGGRRKEGDEKPQESKGRKWEEKRPEVLKLQLGE